MFTAASIPPPDKNFIVLIIASITVLYKKIEYAIRKSK